MVMSATTLFEKDLLEKILKVLERETLRFVDRAHSTLAEEDQMNKKTYKERKGVKGDIIGKLLSVATFVFKDKIIHAAKACLSYVVTGMKTLFGCFL